MYFVLYVVNFIISGSSVNYYFSTPANCCQPFNRLISYHWGSVCAGSFMTGLFAIPDAIFDFFKVLIKLFSLTIFYLDMPNVIPEAVSGSTDSLIL